MCFLFPFPRWPDTYLTPLVVRCDASAGIAMADDGAGISPTPSRNPARIPGCIVDVFFDVTPSETPVGCSVCCFCSFPPGGVSGFLRMNSTASPVLPQRDSAGWEDRIFRGFIVASTPDFLANPCVYHSDLEALHPFSTPSSGYTRDVPGSQGCAPTPRPPPVCCVMFVSVGVLFVCAVCVFVCCFCVCLENVWRSSPMRKAIKKSGKKSRIGGGKTGSFGNRFSRKLTSSRDSDQDDLWLLVRRRVSHEKEIHQLQRKQRQSDTRFLGPVLRRFRCFHRSGVWLDLNRSQIWVGNILTRVEDFRVQFRPRPDQPNHVPGSCVLPPRAFEGLLPHDIWRKEKCRTGKRCHSSSPSSSFRYSSYCSRKNWLCSAETASTSSRRRFRHVSKISSESSRHSSPSIYRRSCFAIPPSNEWGSSSVTRRRNSSGVLAMMNRKRKKDGKAALPVVELYEKLVPSAHREKRVSLGQKPWCVIALVSLNRPPIIPLRGRTFNDRAIPFPDLQAPFSLSILALLSGPES